jgi:DNA-binding response OmpR family regulator
MPFLVVEDDPLQALALQEALSAEHFQVDVVRDGAEALKLPSVANYKVILLDLELPNIDGLTLLRHFRSSGVYIPVLALSCDESVERRIEALQAGADDCVCKPFAIEELLARIRALLRRPPLHLVKLRVADLEMDCIRRIVRRASTRIHLGGREFTLLESLLRAAGRAVPRSVLLQQVWKGKSIGPTSLDVCICSLRRKIDVGRERALLRYVRGFGYMIADPEIP